MNSQTISHYEILEKVGEGGMGMVYKAIDTKLDRTVALKFLAPHLVSNEESRQRFIREAKAAAALQHPNICTVYEIDEADGRTFIAMAYLEGEELTKHIEKGPLSVERLLDIAIQVARGLQEAHGKGVVHRDIKPANIMLTVQGQAVLMDFGLAQLAHGESKLTKEGTSLGTCAYMSPEQTTGDKLDLRTDVWALGVVLYEMATGQVPFQGHYEQAILYSILNDSPQPITAVRTGVPPELERIVNKCLAKRAGERYQTVSDFLADLSALKRGTESGAVSRPSSGSKDARPSSGSKDARPSIAVLPFENRSRDEDDEYFSDGVTEDIISALAKIEGLRVTPRASAFRFKGESTAVRQVAEKLNVGCVLTGTIRRAGSRLRITVELIDAAEEPRCGPSAMTGCSKTSSTFRTRSRRRSSTSSRGSWSAPSLPRGRPVELTTSKPTGFTCKVVIISTNCPSPAYAKVFHVLNGPWRLIRTTQSPKRAWPTHMLHWAYSAMRDPLT